MSQSTDHLTNTGKITVLTALFGVVAFFSIFLLNLGGSELERAQADTATTSVTVVNTPPQWTVDAQEFYGSSTTTPTNAGDIVTWTAVGTDANAERYYLLICSTSATPTPNSDAAPTCDAPTNQWTVSASTTSGTIATAATTTAASWAESNAWFAWICDSNSGTPRCNATYKQGTGTTSSPFSVNHRPTFTIFSDTSPANPGSIVTFHSTSSDSDTDGAQDTVQLVVCNQADYDTSTNACGAGGTLASSTQLYTANASSSYTISIPTQDQDYTAYGYIRDNHGFEATGGAQGTNSTLTVSNVAPTISEPILINGGSDITLTVEAGETTGFTLSYVAVDNNSCVTSASTSEITSYALSLYRSGIGSTTCDAQTPGSYDPNNCYPSSVGSSVWNLSCTRQVGTCTDNTDPTETWNCSFPLWYIADPTDGVAGSSTVYGAENWNTAIQGVDDDLATGTKSQDDNGAEVTSFLMFALNSLTIPYGSLEPGQQTDPIVATTTFAATGNVGLDQRLSGESMCPTYSSGNDCPNSATSTIPESEQVYATTTRSYASSASLSSTTATELETNIAKSTATSTQATKNTFWGIRVPGTVTFAGNYTGENTFIGITGESVDWNGGAY